MAGAVIAVACAVLSGACRAQDAGNRGLLDSSVQTLVGGNIGDGSTTPTSVPLVNLKGGAAVDSAGAVYFTEGNRVLKLAGGTLAVFAGSQTSGYTEGTKGAGARFSNPGALASDPGNNIYVADNGNSRIRKIAPDGTTTTVAGNGNSASGIADIGRPAVDASLPTVTALAVNGSGDIFFVSTVTVCLYKIPAATGLLTILAGNGANANLASGAVAANNPLGGTPRGLAVLSDGTPIYSQGTCIRNVKSDGTNVVIAGAYDVNPVAAGLNLPVAVSPLFPDDGTFPAVQTFNTASATAPNSFNNVGGLTPTQLAVDGSTIYFVDLGVGRIRSFTIGGAIQTVFGERSEGGQTTAGGFRGNNSPAATNTPRLGLVVSAGPDQVLQTAAGAGDVIDGSSRPARIFSSVDGVSSTATAAGDDVLVVPNGTAIADDQTPRNDDPKESCSLNAQVAALNNVVTFVDDGNFLVRQFTVGGNVVTVAGDTVPFRVQNLGSSPAYRTQAISDGLPIPASNAAIFTPNQVARDASGNIFFDANDDVSGGNHKIYKFDATAKTVTAIAGPVLTNGFRSSGGDGAPAANVPLTGLGAQVSVLADGTLLFADTVPPLGNSNDTIRAVSPAGVLSTIAGLPGVAGSFPPDVDSSLVNAAGNLVSVGRVGLKATQVPFNHPNSVIGTTLNDFIVADTGNLDVVIVSGGIVTQEIPVGVLPSYLAQSGTNLFVAGSAGGRIDKIDLSTTPATVTPNFVAASITVTGTSTTASATITAIASTAGLAPGDVLTAPAGGFLAGATIVSLTVNSVTLNATSTLGAAGVNFTFQHPAQNIRGLAVGTNGLFVLGANGTVSLISTASLSTVSGVVQYSFPATTGTATGLAVSGTTVAFSENFLGAGDIKTFTDTGTITPAPTVTQVAGAFTNVVSNGFNLQTHLSFNAFAPLVISGSNFISGDDAALQFRLITPAAPAPNSTATVIAGAGAERNGGLDGEVATSATDIGACGGLAVDSTGAVFFSDRTANTVRRVANNVINTIAGVPGISPPSLATVVDGPALKTLFSTPAGLAFKPGDDTALFVCDKQNNVVRKISPTDGTGTVTRIAGVPGDGAGDGGDGSLAINARLQNPIGVAVDGNGDVYIADGGSSGSRIHVVSANGIMTQLGGGGADRPTYTPIPAIETDFLPNGIAIDLGGKVYVPTGSSSQGFIVRVAGGNAQIVVGDPLVGGFNGDGLPGFDTLVAQPTSAAFSPALGLVFSDTGNNRIRAVANLAEATNSAPTAKIVANPDHLGMAPFKVVLDGTTSTDDDGDIVSYSWDFGDGTVGYGPTVEKVYPNMGEYVVTLSIADSAGHVSTAQETVFSAIPILASDTSGKGSFNVGFGSKGGNDSLSLQIKNVHNLKNENGKPFTLFIGPFSITGTMGGKASKPSKTGAQTLGLPADAAPLSLLAAKPKPPKKGKTSVTASIDPNKGTLSVNLKGASLAAAFASFGVGNENTIGGRTATVPVVISVNNGDLVVGDKFLFGYKGKFNGNASGKFSQ